MAKQKKGITSTSVELKKIDIVTLAIDRSPKSLMTWKTALKAAESIVSPTRRLLYDLYSDILLDPHLSSVVDKRFLAVTNTDICFSKEGEEHEEVQEVINTNYFEDLLVHIVSAKIFGFSLINFQNVDFFDIDNLGECEIIDRRYVKPELGIVTRTPYEFSGIDYTVPPIANEVLAVGKKKDLGLLLKAAPWVLLKRGDIDDWATFNELFGMPLRKGKYNSSIPGEKEKLTEALAEAGSKAFVILPDGTEVEFVTNSSSGNNDNYEKFARFCDEQISKLFLGNTLTTESGSKGARSLGEVHMEVEEKIARSDRRYVLRYLRKFKTNILARFYDVAGYDFDFREEEESLTIEQQFKIDLAIHKDVARLKKEYFAEKYNVEFADEENAPEANETPEEQQTPETPEEQKAVPNLNQSDDNDIKLWDKLKELFQKGFFR